MTGNNSLQSQAQQPRFQDSINMYCAFLQIAKQLGYSGQQRDILKMKIYQLEQAEHELNCLIA